MHISVPRATLSVDAIQSLLNAALARAKELNVRVHISIYDASAQLAGFVSCDGASRIAVTTAHEKAFTAVSTGMTTQQWAAYVDSIPATEQKIIDSIGGYIAAKGGYPVIENGLVLGGIGVSGANQDIDADIAEAALKAIGLT